MSVADEPMRRPLSIALASLFGAALLAPTAQAATRGYAFQEFQGGYPGQLAIQIHVLYKNKKRHGPFTPRQATYESSVPISCNPPVGAATRPKRVLHPWDSQLQLHEGEKGELHVLRLVPDPGRRHAREHQRFPDGRGAQEEGQGGQAAARGGDRSRSSNTTFWTSRTARAAARSPIPRPRVARTANSLFRTSSLPCRSATGGRRGIAALRAEAVDTSPDRYEEWIKGEKCLPMRSQS